MEFDQEEKTFSGGDDAYLLNDGQTKRRPNSLRFKQHTSLFIIGLLIFLLFSSNLALFLSLTRKEGARQETSLEIEILGDVRQTLHEDPLYVSPDKEIADAAWDNYTITGFVALPTSWAMDRGWKTGLQMPGDPQKSMFVIDAFHQIHCLVLIRKMWTDLLEGKPPSGLSHTRRHIDHCYDSLRQAITCRAHSVPLYVPEDGDSLLPGVGQQRECRDWDALQRFALDHTACYNGVKCPSMFNYINN